MMQDEKAIDKPSTDNTPQHPRRIKSFIVRSSRMTESQQKGFDQHFPQWGLKSEEAGLVDWQATFSNQNPLVLEIGFGMGDSLAQMAEESPDLNFIGVEVHPPGVGRLLSLIDKKQLNNLRVFNEDVMHVFERSLANESLSRVNIYFPDPWHKTKHNKRRLIQSQFVRLIAQKLKPKGVLHIATDWEDYALQIMRFMQNEDEYTNVAGEGGYVNAADWGRPETKFERRGRKLGHGVWDLVFQKTS